jgi:hypothetical protein
MSLDVKKGESGFSVAHSELERGVGRKFLDDELLERCGQRGGKQRIWPSLRNECDRARFGAAQLIV